MNWFGFSKFGCDLRYSLTSLSMAAEAVAISPFIADTGYFCLCIQSVFILYSLRETYSLTSVILCILLLFFFSNSLNVHLTSFSWTCYICCRIWEVLTASASNFFSTENFLSLFSLFEEALMMLLFRHFGNIRYVLESL